MSNILFYDNNDLFTTQYCTVALISKLGNFTTHKLAIQSNNNTTIPMHKKITPDFENKLAALTN